MPSAPAIRCRYLVESCEKLLPMHKMFILYADCEEEAKKFAENIKAKFGDLDIVLQPVGPVIGSHCGPGTIGLIFHATQK